MKFDVKAIALLFVMRSTIGAVVLTIAAVGREQFLTTALPFFGGIILIAAAMIWIGRGLINLKEWSWYTTVAVSMAYIFINTVRFLLGDQASIFQIAMDSAIIVYLFLRKGLFNIKTEDIEFRFKQLRERA